MVENSPSIRTVSLERLLEIQRRIGSLSEQDIVVLFSLPSKSMVIINPTKISLNNYLLPVEVEESLTKLQELKFISEVVCDQYRPSRKALVVNQNGLDAQMLTRLIK